MVASDLKCKFAVLSLEVLRAKTENNWKLGQFKGTCNTDVPEIVTDHMKKWFNERKDSPRHIEAPKSLAGFTLSEYYAYIAANGLPIPAQLEYNHFAEEALNQNDIELDTEFAPGPLPEYEGLDFMVKPVRRGEEMAEVLVYNPYPPRTYLESAKAGEIFVYIAGISEKRLVFLSAENFPERKIEIERVYPHSEHIMVRLREWIDNYVFYNGFPLTFKDENQMEFVFA